jgi:hypothetical protein
VAFSSFKLHRINSTRVGSRLFRDLADSDNGSRVIATILNAEGDDGAAFVAQVIKLTIVVESKRPMTKPQRRHDQGASNPPQTVHGSDKFDGKVRNCPKYIKPWRLFSLLDIL